VSHSLEFGVGRKGVLGTGTRRKALRLDSAPAPGLEFGRLITCERGGRGRGKTKKSKRARTERSKGAQEWTSFHSRS